MSCLFSDAEFRQGLSQLGCCIRRCWRNSFSGRWEACRMWVGPTFYGSELTCWGSPDDLWNVSLLLAREGRPSPLHSSSGSLFGYPSYKLNLTSLKRNWPSFTPLRSSASFVCINGTTYPAVHPGSRTGMLLFPSRIEPVFEFLVCVSSSLCSLFSLPSLWLRCRALSCGLWEALSNEHGSFSFWSVFHPRDLSDLRTELSSFLAPDCIALQKWGWPPLCWHS